MSEMHRSLPVVLTFGLLLVLTTGCTTRIVDFTVISTKNVDWSRATAFERGNARVQGTDVVHIVVFIPTGIPHMKEAIDGAIESVPGAVALVDGVVKRTGWYIPFIYGQDIFLVEGTPIIDPALRAETDGGLPEHLVIRCGNDGEVVETRAVSEEEFDAIRTEAGLTDDRS